MSLNKRGIVITRPASASANLAQLVRENAGIPILFPALEIAPAPATQALLALIDRLEQYDLAIFISPSAVTTALDLIQSRRAMPALRGELAGEPVLQMAAVGAGSARALARRGFSNVIAPTEQFDSEALLAMPALQDVKNKRVVIFRGVGGRELLAETLTARGAQVEYAECYQRVTPRQDAAPLIVAHARGEVHAVTATSSEGVRNLVAMFDNNAGLLRETPWFVTHPRIAQAAHNAGIATVVITAQGDAGLLAGLLEWFTACR